MANSIQTAKMLLKETLAIRKECETQYRETGTAYNVFKVAKISENEVPICNVLTDLLDPKGLHYRGDTYLKLFMKMVVKPHLEMEVKLNPSKAKVTREYFIHSNNKRIDIVISEGKVFIPIEAKINTVDSAGQLAAYYDYSKSKNESDHAKVLYLTKKGDDATKAEKGVYVSISFERDILLWLDKCLKHEPDERAPVKEMLKQYIKAIREFCGYLEDETMTKKMIELIISSDDNYEAALKIRDAVKELIDSDFDEKLRKLFKEQIINKVIKNFTGAEEYTDDNLWLIFNLKNNLHLSVKSDVKNFVVQKGDKIKTIAAKTKKEIDEKMSYLIHDEFSEKENNYWKPYGGIWANANGRFPDLINETDDLYKYKLYQLYKNNPQSVANWIVSIAEDLEEIKTAE